MPEDRYRIGVQDYIDYHRDGYLVVRELVPDTEVEEIRRHTEELMSGRIVIDGIEPPPPGLTPEQMGQHWLRIHMLQRKRELHERYLLQPRIFEGTTANNLHILARGNTHLAYALPKFGTPCDALDPRETARGVRPVRMMGGMPASTVKGVMVTR